MMRILFLTQWFEPEPAFKGIGFATALRARGHDVDVATAFPNYPGGTLYPGYRIRPHRRETIDGIAVHRLAIWPSHDASSIGRIANYLSFFLTALLFGLMRGGRYDLVYVYHPPITPAAAAAVFCALHRKPFVVEVQDLWPDSVSASNMADGRITRLLGKVCDFVYRRATMVVPQSSAMLERLHKRGVPRTKLRRIYNWATYRPAPPDAITSSPTGFEGRFNIVYGGNLGQAQMLAGAIDATARVGLDHPAVHLHLFGDGIDRRALEAHAARVAPAQVTFHGPVGRDAMDRIFDAADLLLVQLKDDPLYAITIPSKVQHYLACGRPIVAGLAGEAARLLTESGAAIVCPPQDPTAMAEAIGRIATMAPTERTAMGRLGRAYYDTHLGFDRAIDETIAVMDEAAAYRSPRKRDIE